MTVKNQVATMQAEIKALQDQIIKARLAWEEILEALDEDMPEELQEAADTLTLALLFKEPPI